MPYTKEQALKDQKKLEQKAIEADKCGKPIEAGIYRVAAADCEKRIGWKQSHKPSLGPYSSDNPCHCANCGKFKKDWIEGEECIPKEVK